MLPDTPEYIKTRNKVYDELREENMEIEKQNNEWTAIDLSSMFILLIGTPEYRESYEVLHIMQYYGVDFSVEEDNILKPAIRKEMGFSKEDDWPLMTVNSTSEVISTQEVVGKNRILEVLGEAGLVGDHMQHSAYEQ